jgi:hypothetical protein
VRPTAPGSSSQSQVATTSAAFADVILGSFAFWRVYLAEVEKLFPRPSEDRKDCFTFFSCFAFDSVIAGAVDEIYRMYVSGPIRRDVVIRLW